MSVDVEAHINREFTVEDIIEFLRHLGMKGVALRSSNLSSDYFIITFSDGDDQRAIHFHINLGLFGNNLLTTGKWGNSAEWMFYIVKTFGGVFIPDDTTDDNATVISDSSSYYNQGNAIFVLKWAISRGIVKGSSVEDVIKANEAFQQHIGGNKHD